MATVIFLLIVGIVYVGALYTVYRAACYFWGLYSKQIKRGAIVALIIVSIIVIVYAPVIPVLLVATVIFMNYISN